MFNLSPIGLKEKIKTEYNFRRAIVVFMFLLFISTSFLIFLFPSWMVSIYKEKEISLQIEKINQSSVVTSIKEVVSSINKINTELKTIDTSLNYKKVIPLIDTILSKKTKSIYINELTYTSVSSSTTTILLEGVSSTRGSLLSFVKNLEETKSFKTVNLPISNFAKEKDINFSVNLIVEPSYEKI